MAISDFFVEWFPIIFMTTFLLTTIVVQVRKLGHLKMGREMKRAEVIGLLVLLCFNILVALPFMLIYFLFDFGAGLPPIFEIIVISIMFLSYLIPTILVGTFAYFTLEGIFTNWGTHIVSLFATSIVVALYVLDLYNLLGPALPFMFELSIHFIQMGFSYLIIIILCGFCFGGRKKDEAEPKHSRVPLTKQLMRSADNSLRLLVGLGKRIVYDGDRIAYRALKEIYHHDKTTTQKLKQVALSLNIQLDEIISGDDLIFVQQSLEPVSKQFGMLRKPIAYIFNLLILGGIISIILLPTLFFQGITSAIFFMMPAIMFPVIALAAYQQEAKYEAGRMNNPTVNLLNSYLLTQAEFSKRSKIARILTGITMGILLILVVTNLFIAPEMNLTWVVTPLIVLFSSLYLSSEDRLFSEVRLDIDQVLERGIDYIGTIPESEMDPAMGTYIPPEYLVDTIAQSDDATSEPIIHEISLSWMQELEMRGYSDFVKKVKNGSREIYGEHTITINYLGVGAILLFMGLFIFVMFSNMMFDSFFFLFFPIGMMTIGTPVFLYGLIMYFKLRNETRLYGVTRKQITTLLSEFDFRANNIEDLGFITDIHSPSEYTLFSMFPKMILGVIRAAFVRIQDRIKWPNDIVEEIKTSRSSGPKLEVLVTVASCIAFVLLFLWFDSIELFFGNWMELVFLGLAGMMALTGFWSLYYYYNEKSKISEALNRMRLDEENTYRDSILNLIELYKYNLPFPLRVLFVSILPGVDYTGRSYFTTTGIELREAVIIPRV